jgi:hypothetical protein
VSEEVAVGGEIFIRPCAIFADESVGYEYPEPIAVLRPDYVPPDYIRHDAEAARGHAGI